MMLRTIQRAVPLPDSRVRVTWGDGTESVIDLSSFLSKEGVFAFQSDRTRFAALSVGPRGRTLVWRDPEGDEIDLCADALWQLAPQGGVEAA